MAPQFNVSRQTLYNRKEWIKAIMNIQDPQTFFMEIIAGHNEIHDRAAEYLRGDNTAARIGALRLLRDINKDLWEMVNFHELD